MSLNDLPEPIKNHILKETEKNKVMPDNRFGVTELLGCMRKTWYKRKTPKPTPLQSSWYFYRGNLFDDDWTPLFERNQSRSTMRLDEERVVISGKFDFEFEDAICDLKTTNTLDYVRKGGPKLEHIYQVLFYCWNEAKTEGRLYYVSFGDAERFDIRITDMVEGRVHEGNMVLVDDEYHAEVIAKIRGNAASLYKYLVRNEIPERMEGAIETPKKPVDKKFWMCRFCEYCEECYA